MTPDEAACLRLILADPDADGPRLVYADWLDEHGHTDRAEFIRAQCAAAQMPADAARRSAFQQRADVLLEQYRLAWSGPLSGLATRWEFRRGFPDEAHLAARTFLEHADAIFAALPVRHVVLHDVAGHLPALVRLPALARLR